MNVFRSEGAEPKQAPPSLHGESEIFGWRMNNNYYIYDPQSRIAHDEGVQRKKRQFFNSKVITSLLSDRKTFRYLDCCKSRTPVRQSFTRSLLSLKNVWKRSQNRTGKSSGFGTAAFDACGKIGGSQPGKEETIPTATSL